METSFEVRSFDSPIPLDEYRRLPKILFNIILDNLRSAFNVERYSGSVMRCG